MSYQSVEADVIKESREGTVSPLRVCREMATNAAINSAPKLAETLNDACASFNRQTYRANRHAKALKALLFALHARPLFGGPHLSLEDAIAEANAVLDNDQEKAQ